MKKTLDRYPPAIINNVRLPLFRREAFLRRSNLNRSWHSRLKVMSVNVSQATSIIALCFVLWRRFSLSIGNILHHRGDAVLFYLTLTVFLLPSNIDRIFILLFLLLITVGKGLFPLMTWVSECYSQRSTTCAHRDEYLKAKIFSLSTYAFSSSGWVSKLENYIE